MFAPGIIALIVSMALTAAPDLERQALDAAKSVSKASLRGLRPRR